MLISSRARYAVMAMVELALVPQDTSIALGSIAQRQELPLTYMEQLFVKLRQAGLVESTRGPNGGYRLSKSPDFITVSHVIEAVDKPIKATRCGATGGCQTHQARCVTHHLWSSLETVIYNFLDNMSLADVIKTLPKKQEEANVAHLFRL